MEIIYTVIKKRYRHRQLMCNFEKKNVPKNSIPVFISIGTYIPDLIFFKMSIR